MQQHILMRGKTNKALEKTDRRRNGEPGPCASRGKLTPCTLAKGLASQLLSQHVQPRLDLGAQWAFLSDAVLVRYRQARSCLAGRTVCGFGGGEILQENAAQYLMQMGPQELPCQRWLCMPAVFMEGWSLVLHTAQSSSAAAALHRDSDSVFRVLFPPSQSAFALYIGQGGSGLCAAVCIPRDVTLAGTGNCHGCIPFLLLWRYSQREHLIGVAKASGHDELLLCSCVQGRAEKGRCLQPQ